MYKCTYQLFDLALFSFLYFHSKKGKNSQTYISNRLINFSSNSIINAILYKYKYINCRVFDRNGDGYISKTEFKHCMMHFGEQFTDEEVEEMIAEADSNNDGQIDYEEFSKMIRNELA